MSGWDNSKLAKAFYKDTLKRKKRHGTMTVHRFNGASFLVNSGGTRGDRMVAMRFPAPGSDFPYSGITIWNQEERRRTRTIDRFKNFETFGLMFADFDVLQKGTIEDITSANVVTLSKNNAILNICGQRWLLFHSEETSFITRQQYIDAAWKGGTFSLGRVNRNRTEFDDAIYDVIPKNGEVFFRGKWFSRIEDSEVPQLTDDLFAILAHRPTPQEYGAREWLDQENATGYQEALKKWKTVHEAYKRAYEPDTWTQRMMVPIVGGPVKAEFRKNVKKNLYGDLEINEIFVKGTYNLKEEIKGKDRFSSHKKFRAHTFDGWHKTAEFPDIVMGLNG